jgi:hypothetical protein
MIRLAILTALLVIVSAAPAAAQRPRLLPEEEGPPAQWGVAFSFTPKWEVPGGFAGLIAANDAITGPDGKSTVSGSHWSVGFVRGRPGGKEWGLSFSQQRIRAGSMIDSLHDFPCGSTTCRYGRRFTFDDVQAVGAEVSFYVPFLRINERVGLGLNVAGGGARFVGTATVDEGSGTAGVPDVHEQGSIPEVSRSVFYGEPYTWFARAEPGITFTPTRQLRVHVGAGFHFPGRTYFALKTTYFFPRAAP